MADDLVRRRVSVIVAIAPPAALAAKALTATIPIVFLSGLDPTGGPCGKPDAAGRQRHGDQPGHRGARLQAPGIAARIGPCCQKDRAAGESRQPEYRGAAEGRPARGQRGRTSSFTPFTPAAPASWTKRLPCLSSSGPTHSSSAPTPFFVSRRAQIVGLAGRQAIPAVYDWREYTLAGGLMSYGTSLDDAYRLAAQYTGRILKGARPADLPVVKSAFKLVVNLKTAKALEFNVSRVMRSRKR